MKTKHYIQSLILAICFAGAVNAQPKNKVDSVELSNNSLWQYINGAKSFRGSVVASPSGGISKDANGNFILGRNPIFTGNNYDNLILGNNNDMRGGSHSLACLGTDCIVYPGASYSIFGGDAHHIGGYSSTTFGYLNKNFVDGGTAIGTNVKLGESATNNLYSRSIGVGSLMNIQNTDVYLFGKGFDNSPWIQQGTFLIYGNNKFGLLPDGRIVINGIAYRFPTTQGSGVLTNDGNGNLSWSNLASISKSNLTPETSKQIPAGKYLAYDMMGRPYTMVRIQ